ncbi:MAG: TolC family protein [Bryobacteraceae bacterium]
MWICIACMCHAQDPISVERPSGPFVLRPYKMPFVPPIRMSNSDRLHSLIRAGKLYLTVQDAIALAIENNLDLEVDRYGPVNADWALERAQAGGPLRGVTSGNSLVNQVTGGQGVVGSQVSAGLATNNNNSGNGNGNAIVSQIGPVTQNLDAVFQNATGWSHTTSPQANTLQSQTTALVDTRHVYDSFVQQGLISGGYVQVTANESYLKENTPTDIINPSVAPVTQIYFRHNLLFGFGSNVNSRFIQVGRKNILAANETFRSQLLNLVAVILNQYWDLVTAIQDLKVKQSAVDAAQDSLKDTQNEISLGVLARVEILRAQAELSSRKQDLSIAVNSVSQQQTTLKNSLSRNGLEDPILDAVDVVPLDRIQVPEKDDLPPLRQLVATALAKRPDVALTNLNSETTKILASGTQNGILPSLQVIASTTNNGLAGNPTPQPPGLLADPYFVGGLGTALRQVAGRDFPSERAGVLFQGTLRNRIAQGDYGVDQLQLRQNELVARKSMNQIVVDIANQMVALRQARSRYRAAVDSRLLQDQLLEKERQRFVLGDSTFAAIITAQQSQVTARSNEVAALSAYSHARIALDQVVGETLEHNHVFTNDALEGKTAAAEPAVHQSPDGPEINGRASTVGSGMRTPEEQEHAIALLRNAYAVFNRGDIAAAVAQLDPQIEWIEPAAFPAGGTYQGRAEVARYLTQSRAPWAEGSSEPERFIVSGDRVVVFVHARFRLLDSHEWREVRLADVYIFRDGTPVKMRAFADRDQAVAWAASAATSSP